MNDYLEFSEWLNTNGTIIGNTQITTQAGSNVTNSIAGGEINYNNKSTKKPKVSKTNFDIGDFKVAEPTTVHGIPQPQTFTSNTYQVNQVVADKDASVFTPQVNLTDLFKINFNPLSK